VSRNTLHFKVVSKAKNPPRAPRRAFENTARRAVSSYFCQVRFLWRFAFKRFRRLCLFILRRRFFFRLPMVRGQPCARLQRLSSRIYETGTAIRRGNCVKTISQATRSMGSSSNVAATRR